MPSVDFSQLVGRQSTPVATVVEVEAIRKFAAAIGDDNPAFQHLDEAGRILAPPTFSRTFRCGEIEGLNLKTKGLIHGEQSFTYYEPIFSGQTVYVSMKLVDVRKRSGRLGDMTILSLEIIVAAEDARPLMKESMTVIVPPGVAPSQQGGVTS